MSAWWIVMRKELRDAFRDRRTVMVAFVVMPLAVPLLLAGIELDRHQAPGREARKARWSCR